MMIFTVMLIMGILLGFVGAGGSGFIIAILVTIFGIPIHTALATAMAGMFLTMISGTISHYREGNIDFKSSIITGMFGALGSYNGTFIAHRIPEHDLIWMTSGMLFLSALLMWLRTKSIYKTGNQKNHIQDQPIRYLWIKACLIGLITGTMSGTFGIGSAPFIQLAILIFFKNSLKKVVGSTMLIILPIALFGAIGYYQSGYLDFTLLVKVVAGTMIGSYLGAKFTSIAPRYLLRVAMISTPLISGLLLLF